MDVLWESLSVSVMMVVFRMVAGASATLLVGEMNEWETVNGMRL